jgi:hypothetical protein
MGCVPRTAAANIIATATAKPGATTSGMRPTAWVAHIGPSSAGAAAAHAATTAPPPLARTTAYRATTMVSGARNTHQIIIAPLTGPPIRLTTWAQDTSMANG